MKKKILTVIAIIAALALSLFMVACGDDGVGSVTFKVTAKYNAEQGSVTVANADGAQKTEFGAGAKVVVTVTAKDGYTIDAFTVNGVDTELTNGVYGFVISANTVVEATFKQSGDDDGGKTPEELFAEAFESVQTTFMAVGSYTYKEEGADALTYTLTTVFGNGAVNIVEVNADGEIVYDDVYVDRDGKIAQPYHTLDNKIAYNYPTVEESFADYDNPFKKLSVTDFTATETQNVFALTAEDEVVTAAATALTGWNESIESFTVTIADGKVARINITTKRITVGTGEDAVYYSSVYAFTLGEWGTAEVDEEAFTPYSTATEHTALKNALKTASEAKNYTIVVSEVSLTDLDGDLEYNVYVTENAVYYDCEDYEEGYVQMGTGASAVVYPFDYNPETELVTLRDATVFPTIASMRASFDGFAPEIFELDEYDGYILRDECYTLDNIRSILINFGEGIDQIRLYASYAIDVRFVLKDGALYQVELYYVVSDAYIMRTLTYVDWDETTLPIGFDNCEHTSVLDYYVGTYTDGTVTAVIDKNGIVINGQEFEIAGYDIQYDLFTGEWNGEEWYITKQGEKQLLLFHVGEDADDDVTYTLTSTAIAPVEIPEEFGGVWSKDDKTVAIAYNMVEYNGTMLTVLSYDEDDGSLYATDGEKTYRMFAEENTDGNPVLLFIVYVDGLSTAYYDMTAVEDAVIMPELFVGTFEKYDSYYDTDFKVIIGLTTVEIYFDDDKLDSTISSVDYDGYWEITLDVDGEDYYISEGYNASQIGLMSFGSYRFNVMLDKVTSGGEYPEPPAGDVVFPEKYYGEYEGEDDGVTYYITISAEGITVKIGDGPVKNATVTAYDDYWDSITIDIDGEEYGIATDYYDNTAINFSDANFTIFVTLNPVGAPSVTIPEKFRGTFEGEKNGAAYVIVITENGVAVSIDGVAKTVAVQEYDATEDYIAITLDGIEYSVMDASYDSPISQIRLMSSDYSVMVTLNRSTETGGDDNITIPEKFYGEYWSADESYGIEINQDGITIVSNDLDGEIVIVAYDEYEGFTVTIGGEEYTIMDASYDSPISQIRLMNSDYSVMVALNRAE